jgi:putative ABC transport system permease protein
MRLPYTQHAFNGATLSLVVRTAGDPNALAATVRRLAREWAPDVPMRFTTMEALLSENVAAPRFRTLLLAVSSGLALCLAMAGVYGVMAYAVGQRSSAVGLRLALGASTGSVLRLILGQGLALAGIGLALGLAGAFANSRLLTTMSYTSGSVSFYLEHGRRYSAGRGRAGCQLCAGKARIEDRSATAIRQE